ncbi:hypothetical protein M422DRAFT_273038 [Sphaerobolus stellatus SS14]|uniref:Uncharacterized protein n=1 Tax=Sphaerobolus stellatus (strain SS14) TaxID=990650 RepID=A0A0C9TA83_SPHS4|nr:hypothetical protein M422DRAFT_273038 [Sphaerobolus stellatus SS14]
MFNRRPPEHKVVSRTNPPRRASNADELHINTQFGTQWDGLRHFGIFSEKCFYQGVPASEIPQGVSNISDPTNVDKQAIKLGIHSICGRGVLVDLVKLYTEDGTKPLPYDPWKTHPIPVSDIKAAADKQGVVFRPANILLLRVGFMQKFNSQSPEERNELAEKPETFAGIEQSLETKEFLWNNHFAAIASDQPSMEAWPPEGVHLHQTILGNQLLV